METLKEILMRRDGHTSKSADDLIDQAREDLFERLAAGESGDDICMEWFGLEPDYIFELVE